MRSALKVAPQFENALFANTQDTTKSTKHDNSVSVSFTNINYFVRNGRNRKQILNDITGLCNGGEVTAIMGSSGAGKTTLLNILSCRVQKGQDCQITGQIKANGKEYDGQLFPKFAGYVMQNDILMETLTPLEAFTFVASLKYKDKFQIQQKVNQTIKSLKLSKCQDVYIGGITLKGISGGERRRTSIGVELVADPSVIILDEPTSGLDSFTAFQIIHLLKQLAQKQNKTIIMTIHQPSTDISDYFDKLLLLNQGQLVYQGKCKQLVDYFSSIGFQCPNHSNPLDYLLQILNNNDQNEINTMLVQYEQNFLKQINIEINENINSELKLKERICSNFDEILLIATRDFINAKRNPTQFYARIVFAILFGLLHGGVFWKVGNKNEDIMDVFSLAGSLFILITNFGTTAVFYNILGFIMEKHVFLREENSQLYEVYTYYLGKQIIEFPLSIIQPLISCMIYYWMSDYNDIKAEYILMHLVICTIFYLTVCSFGMMVGCIFRDITGATTLGVTFLLPVIIFGGYYANPKSFWKYASWFEYLSPLKYGFQAICLNEFKDKQFIQDPTQLYGFTYSISDCLLILFAFIVGLRILSLIMLYLIRIKLQ